MLISIFTDGSSRGNPGPGGWGTVIRTPKEVKELGGREDHTTNNRMELSAAINALMYVAENDIEGEILLQTDSRYVINGITSWVKGWQRNGWKTGAKTDVENRDLWEALDLAAKGLKIEWRYVKGHAGHPGNERCDEIATSFADKSDVELYHGPALKYPIDLDAAPSPSAVVKKKKSSSGVKAHSYLSLVDGEFNIDKTWAECEKRVKGKKGARFKKSISADDEKAIMKEWGVK